METLTMSQKERRRIGIMTSVKASELNLVEAAEVLGLGYRQTKRIWKRYAAEGDASAPARFVMGSGGTISIDTGSDWG
jgi:hypothetical protein